VLKPAAHTRPYENGFASAIQKKKALQVNLMTSFIGGDLRCF
jgi:hypothetical protein